MSNELQDLSLGELQEVINEAKIELHKRQKYIVLDVYLQMVQLASGIGMSVDDVIAQGRQQSGHKAKTAAKVAPKYMNPERQNETWTGRGRMPNWLTVAISKGDSLESFLIQD